MTGEILQPLLVGLEVLTRNVETVVSGRLGIGDEPHVRLLGGVSCFAAVAGDAGTDDILPAMLTTAVAGNHMV